MGNFAGVASNSRLFFIYNHNAGSKTIKTSVGSGSISELPATLYGPFTELTYNGGAPQAIPQGITANKGELKFNAAQESYYYLELIPSQTLYSTNTLVFVNYNTDRFKCPYTDGISDYNDVFRGCDTNMPSKDYPCLLFDSVLAQCTYCQPPWVS